MPFFSKVFRSRDGGRSSSKLGKHADNTAAATPAKPRWEDSWSRKEVSPGEIQELIHVCTHEMKSRALDMPFLLLPFRLDSDPTMAKYFIRNFFRSQYEGTGQFRGEGLRQELRLTEPMVLCSIMKWCWSRLPGGVVTWDAYELFKVGEQDSNMARHSFDTFIPLSVDSEARKQIIFDFFDLLAAIAARGKTNGLGGRKLSRMAGWWTFELSDQGKGFDGGYKSWSSAADATSHLFFAYLRSLSPDALNGINGISALPRSLQALVSQTEYPPETPMLMHTTTTKVVMIVDSVSPTPFALLRRAKGFEYRDDDQALQQFSSYEDPVQALTDECRRVLNCISSTNQSSVISAGTANRIPDPTWSRFEDMGFSGVLGGPANANGSSMGLIHGRLGHPNGLRTTPRSGAGDLGRPTTPSWADFLSSGFADENGRTAPSAVLLPPDKVLPPIGEAARVHSSQSHLKPPGMDKHLEPGELASITRFDLDETFWWVWMTSLAGEEPPERKAVFGRCALIETDIPGAKWLVMEEQVKGASPRPEEGAYIAEKKSRFTFGRRGRLGRRKSTGKKPTKLEPYDRNASATPMSKTSIGPDQHARIQAAAAKLAQQQRDQAAGEAAQRRGRVDDSVSIKTNSVLSLQPQIMSEAAPAMKWAKEFDKDVIRARYLGDRSMGRGFSIENLSTINGSSANIANGSSSPAPSKNLSSRDLPSLPQTKTDHRVPPKEVQTYRPNPPAPKVETSSSAQAPMTVSTPLDEKPAIEVTHSDQHPAYRRAPPSRKPVTSLQQGVADTGAVGGSPESKEKKHSPKKLKKHTTTGGGGGFKKLFGKKKEGGSRSNTPQPEEPQQSSFQPPANRSNRMSGFVKKQAATFEKPPAPIEEKPKPVTPPPVVEPTPAVTSEDEAAHTQFNQGPLDDVPAFVPDDASEESIHALPQPPRHTGYEEVQPSRGEPHPVADPSPDDVSESSVDLTRQISPSDRWAQIRKNAADRAARLSEEQSRRSQSQSQSVRTDDGETSGEETIESRVARIKARVAELTGNMDAQGNVAPAAKR